MGQKQAGFTLIELSIVISIVAAISIAFLSWTMPGFESHARKYRETKNKMQQIAQSIANYRMAKGRLACPANPTLTPNSNVFNAEHLTVTAGEGMDCIAHITGQNVAFGSVPTKSLGLPADYMYDGWGRKFSLFVSSNLCGNVSGATGGCTPVTYAAQQQGSITVSYADSATDMTTQAAFVIVSHGPNGHGAYRRNGVQVGATMGTDDEDENADTDTNAVLEKGDITSTFDDIVIYRTKPQLDAVATTISSRLVEKASCTANGVEIGNITTAIGDTLDGKFTADEAKQFSIKKLNNTSTNVEGVPHAAMVQVMLALQEICLHYYPELTPQCPTSYSYDTTLKHCYK